jgi:hypothetical protein
LLNTQTQTIKVNFFLTKSPKPTYVLCHLKPKTFRAWPNCFLTRGDFFRAYLRLSRLRSRSSSSVFAAGSTETLGFQKISIKSCVKSYTLGAKRESDTHIIRLWAAEETHVPHFDARFRRQIWLRGLIKLGDCFARSLGSGKSYIPAERFRLVE